MSSSVARLSANHANAQHSTGPRTPEGQSRSSQNARTHGLTARDVIIAPGQHEEFEEMLNGYQNEIQPDGQLQQTLFDELVAAAWNLRRIRRMEVQHSSGTPDDDKKLDRLARHHTRLERTLHRSLKELKALQTNAVFRAALPDEWSDCVPQLANAEQISKRSQQVTRKWQHDYIRAAMAAPVPNVHAEKAAAS